jgi:putative membrane protein
LHGIPRSMIHRLLRPLFRLRLFHPFCAILTHPAVAWLAMNIAYLGWHVPLAFELTFRSETIHNLEHLCFFTTSVMFWWVVIAPWPSRPAWSRWTIIPFLLSADVVNTVLSATLAFSGRVLYPSYADAVRVSALTPLQDQIAAGVEMWVFGSLVFLIPAIFATYKLFSTHSSELSLG